MTNSTKPNCDDKFAKWRPKDGEVILCTRASAWLQAISPTSGCRWYSACADEAAKTGTYAWLYDEDKWPSGFAGGEVPEKNESYRSRALVLLPSWLRDSRGQRLVQCSLQWRSITRFARESRRSDSKWFNGASYVDLMNPEAVREFIDCTHERYKKACGEQFRQGDPRHIHR